MSKRQILMLLGVWVIVLFNPGFPPDVKQILGVITGALIVIVSYKVKPDASSRAASERDLPYVEHHNEQ